MALSAARSREACAVCRDRIAVSAGECCGRCQRIVCRACCRSRGRSHESVLCDTCSGAPRRAGFRGTHFYRAWRRWLAGGS